LQRPAPSANFADGGFFFCGRGILAAAAPIVYLTCEIKGRDLESRLLIAAHLVKLGYYAVVGQYWGLGRSAGAALRGVYHFKTANNIQAVGMATVKGHGHKVVASDEEVLGSSEALAASTTDQAVFEHCDRYFAFNESHKRAILKAFPNADSRVIVTGSARGDLLRMAAYARPHARPYVLINTSFGLINSMWGDLEKAVGIYATGMGWDLARPEDAAVMKARVEYEIASLRETNALLAWLASQRKYDVIVRPHPTERAELWEGVARGHDHVHVRTASDPFAWTKHAALMIHSDSTLGTEVTLFDTPTLNLSPLEEWARRLITRDINFTVTSAVQAQEPISLLLADGSGPLAAPFVTDVFPPNSAETTARELAKLLPKPGPLSGMPWAKTERHEKERAKFTVSPEEFRTAVARVLPIAGSPRADVMDLDDSVVLLLPA
jgi:surface carbohydrate biosynthesis protein